MMFTITKILLYIINNANAYYNKGNALDKLGRYDEAIKHKPDYAYAYYNKGNALAELGRYDEALHCYDEAIKLKPDDAYAYNNKGHALAELGRYDEALHCYDEGLKLKPDDAYAYNNKGNALAELGRYDKALHCYNEAIKLKPDYAYAYNNKGHALAELGRYDEALHCYDEGLKLKPDDAYAYNNKGHALAALGRYDEALHCYDEAIKLKPDYASAYNNKGNALAALGRYDEALHCYDEAIKLKSNALCYCNKGRLLNKLNKSHEALECFNAARVLIEQKNFDVDLSKGNKAFINNTLAEDREQLIKSLVGLQQSTQDMKTDAAKLAQTPKLNNIDRKKITKQTKVIEEEKQELISKITDSLDPNKTKAFSADEQHQLNQKLISEVETLKASVHHLTTEIQQISQRVDTQDADVANMKVEVSAMFDNLKSQFSLPTTVPKNHELLRQKIENIEQKLSTLCSKQELYVVKTKVNELMAQNPITEIRLDDLEYEVDNLIKKQNMVNLQANLAEIKQRIDADNTKYKNVMQNTLVSITEKISELALKEDVIKVNDEVIKLKSSKELTRGRMNDLEDIVDDTLAANNNVTVNVVMCSEIIYDNPLLAHPQLFSEALDHYSYNTAVELSQRLSNELVDEAINCNDPTLVLAGLLSLH